MGRFLEMYMSNHTSTISTNSSNASAVNDESSPLLVGTNSVFVTKNSLPVTWSVIFTLCFLEAIGLYSLIVALLLVQ